MTQKQLVALVRKLIADEQATGFTEGGNLEQPEGTQELINYLDRAVDTYSKRQASAGDIRFMKRATITNGGTLPSDFIMFCGVVPVTVEAGTTNFFGSTGTMPIRYFARLPYVSSYGENDALPYEHEYEVVLAALAAIYALNKHEFEVSQDLALLGMGGVPSGNTGE